MHGWRAMAAGAALALALVAGCGGDDGSGSDTSRSPTTLDIAALEGWLTSLSSPEGIWWHCQAKFEGDPAGTFTNLYLVAWDGFALADGPADPVVAGAWRGFVEAGTVWSAAVAAGVDEPGQLDAVVAQHTELIDALTADIDEEVVLEVLPAPPTETLDC